MSETSNSNDGDRTRGARARHPRAARASLLGALAGAAAASGALVLPSIASAAVVPPAPVAASSAAALTTRLPSFTLATGTSATSSTSAGALLARGAGVLQPSPSGEATATAAPGHSDTAPAACGGSLPAFPAPFTGAVTAKAACGSAVARSVSAASGTATATGEAASLNVDLAPLLSQIVKKATPLASALQGVLGKLPPIPGSGESVGAVIQSVEKAVTGHETISVVAGSSASTTTDTASGWSTTARATGSTITILPGGGSGGAPLAKIIIGGASATAGVHRAANGGGLERPVASDNPSLVTVEVDAPAVGPKTFSVVPGQSMTILKGTPLQSTISVASGSVTTSPSGVATAHASAVSVSLAEGLGASSATAEDGGLHLALADATATAAPQSAPKTTTPASPPPSLAANTVPNATAPHTGLPWAGAAPVLAVTGLLGAGLLGWPRLRRRLASVRSGSSSSSSTPRS